MKRQITQYINSITVDHVLDSDYNSIEQLQYMGDGVGDFENIGDDTTDNCLTQYIIYCKDQINLAKTELRKRKC